MIGKTLGHYEITSLLGKGGMGEVYQAKDLKLGRDVAIKVLPEEFAKDADRVARFQREAKLLASLNHPNIAAIHGLEESGRTNFLVLELVEGETLADRIKAGPVPVEEALKLALQIAEAFEAAHEKGVIHRDLKPANIKVTPEGKVKVLDFGLAKAFAGEQESLNLSNSPTLSNAATQQGVILGTAAFMSPEQARGKSVDKRADIWAFGCVLYEMLTGQEAFQGEDVTEILAAVVKGSPDLSLLLANLHCRVREVIVRCLQKDLKKRYHDIADAKYELEQALSDPGGVLLHPVAAMEPQNKLRTILPWAAAALVLGLIIAGVAVWIWRAPEPPQIVRFDYELPDDQQFPSDLDDPVLAVSPDGKQLAYSTPKGIYLLSVDQMAAKLIQGTEGNPLHPFFSPDGKWIGYIGEADQKLKKIPVNGGVPVTICDSAFVNGRCWWCSDNTILYNVMPNDLMRVSANGGTAQPIVRTKAAIPSSPQLLPNEKFLLYESHGPSTHTVIAQMLGSNEPQKLLAGVGARYLPTGHLLYGAGNALFAVAFDPDKLEVSGGSISVLEGVYLLDSPQYAVSDSGTLAYIPGKAIAESGRTIAWVSRDGKEELLRTSPNFYTAPRISPDGTKVALSIEVERGADIWIWDLARNAMTKLTSDEGSELSPLWSRDGKHIFYGSENERSGIYRKAANGTGEGIKVGSAQYEANSLSWSGDGKMLVFESSTTLGIGTLSVEGKQEAKSLLQGKQFTVNPDVSPDGKWMAYTSEESGRMEIYVRPFPDVNSGKWPVSINGGQEPRWSPSGRELFYRNGDEMVAVTVETTPTFKAGLPKVLFRGKYFSSFGHNWDISPDGKRFLMIKNIQGELSSAEGPRKINIVLNWTEELKRRVPVK
jgi:eukaryotic-like serine/threonine-protein kinase